jgi:hypothetical protein
MGDSTPRAAHQPVKIEHPCQVVTMIIGIFSEIFRKKMGDPLRNELPNTQRIMR